MESTGNPGKILIIDDDARNIFALTAVLRSKKYDCIAAGDMEEAWARLAAEGDIGIILMDMMMPEMDGYEAIPLIRRQEQYQHLPIVAVTAQAMTGDRERCLAVGADAYISKPVDVEELIVLLKKYLKV